nr:DUF952 domain-containing protein [Quadrisphaera sp. RL12-1S]
MAQAAAWERARQLGEYRGSTLGADLDDVGFVHASTASQLPAVVAALYDGEDLADHVLLVVDVAACEAAGSPVRWEQASAGQPSYPHVYGPVPVDAVVEALGVSRDDDGVLVLPDLGGLDVAVSPPRR